MKGQLECLGEEMFYACDVPKHLVVTPPLKRRAEGKNQGHGHCSSQLLCRTTEAAIVAENHLNHVPVSKECVGEKVLGSKPVLQQNFGECVEVRPDENLRAGTGPVDCC